MWQVEKISKFKKWPPQNIRQNKEIMPLREKELLQVKWNFENFWRNWKTNSKQEASDKGLLLFGYKCGEWRKNEYLKKWSDPNHSKQYVASSTMLYQSDQTKNGATHSSPFIIEIVQKRFAALLLMKHFQPHSPFPSYGTFQVYYNSIAVSMECALTFYIPYFYRSTDLYS